MPTINVDSTDKDEFVEMKPDGMSQKEFFGELLAAKRRDEGEIVDPDEIVEQIQSKVASHVEIAAFRGTKEAINGELGGSDV